jgi:hypothetical protein
LDETEHVGVPVLKKEVVRCLRFTMVCTPELMSLHWKTIAIWKVGSSPEVARSSAKDMIVIRRIDDWKNRQARKTVAVGVVIVGVVGVNQELGNRVGC